MKKLTWKLAVLLFTVLVAAACGNTEGIDSEMSPEEAPANSEMSPQDAPVNGEVAPEDMPADSEMEPAQDPASEELNTEEPATGVENEGSLQSETNSQVDTEEASESDMDTEEVK